ncbi:segregation/condensation protein A [Candidatus Micrarchaeota archaeon]|nr:segregation/condensation protein A [Candidatus Micrarchaeota archaeon]
MATQMQLQSFYHLESMVSKPTWKDILLDLMATNSIDPWDIDLLSLSDAFIKKVRDMEKMDFVVEANIILAASILLKYKSNYLKLLSYQSELTEFPADAQLERDTEAIPELTLSSRIPPRRQITLEDLLQEMEGIIKYDLEERPHIPRGSITEVIDLELAGHDIDHDLAHVMSLVRENTDSEGWSLFSRITDPSNMQETVYTLLCLLYLVQMGSLDLRQDKLFGEIFIYLKDGKKTA